VENIQPTSQPIDVLANVATIAIYQKMKTFLFTTPKLAVCRRFARAAVLYCLALVLYCLVLFAGLCSNVLSAPPSGQTTERDLQPLRYNHPGLTVDLGVGLWAWPLPMDYTGNGVLDLVVACPDKPFNGVYLFENTAPDRNVKLPIFRPPVRLGPCGHTLQLSMVAGEPRILMPGHEFPWDPHTRQFDFQRPLRIYPRDSVHPRRVRANMWRYVDYYGRGAHDLVVGVGDWTDYGWDHAYDGQGRWKNGPLRGTIYLIENLGTDANPRYDANPRRLEGEGGPLELFGWPSPNLADFDGDGDLDLLCGEFLDGFTYFENIGTREQPRYASGRRLQAADGRPLAMDLQMITSTAVDWTGNGLIDLVVGDEDGRVALIEHTGRIEDGLPVFEQPVYFQQEAETLKLGALATPWVVDWNGNGRQDIVCGNTAGQIGRFVNLGEGPEGLPRWSAPQLLEVDGAPFRIQAGANGSIQGPAEAKWGYTTLSIADWNQDGLPDIIYNSIHGRVELLLGQPGGQLSSAELETGIREFPPKWHWNQYPSNAHLTQWRTTPVAIDFSGDQQLDLVLLDQQGYLVLREGGGPARRVFVDEDLQPLQLNPRSCGGSGRVKLAVVDWDGDGRLDIIVNSENALWYRNCYTLPDGRQVMKRIGNLAQRNISGHTTSPAIADFDGDGRPDLLIGAEDGRLYHLGHQEARRFASWELRARPPRVSMPAPATGLKQLEFVFNEAPFAQCHASSLVETSRGLVAAWFGGTRERDPDVGVWVSYHDGRGWSGPVEVANGIQNQDLRYPTWNPVLFQPPGDGPTLLFFKTGPSPADWWGEMMVSYDRGRTFTDRRRLPEGILGPIRCKPIVVGDPRRMLCGSSTESDGWRVHFERVLLSDGMPAGSWQRTADVDGGSGDGGPVFGAIQPTLLQHLDGRLQALCRTEQGTIATTFSNDLGESWSPLAGIDLPNNNSGIDAVTLADGRHLLIYNHVTAGESGWGRRHRIDLAISLDGLSWYHLGTLERQPGGELSYPAIIQTADGLVHASWTWNRRRIRHATIDPADIAMPLALRAPDPAD
jgi:predicted neuraminidase